MALSGYIVEPRYRVMIKECSCQVWIPPDEIAVLRKMLIGKQAGRRQRGLPQKKKFQL